MSDRREVMTVRLGKDTEENLEKRHLLWVKKTQVCEMVKIQSRSKLKSKRATSGRASTGVKDEWDSGAGLAGAGRASDQRPAVSMTTCVTITTHTLHRLLSNHTAPLLFFNTSVSSHLRAFAPARPSAVKFSPGYLTFSLISFRFMLRCQAVHH